MSLVNQALRAGHSNTPSPPSHVRNERALVAGGAGTLGAALLEQMLASGRFAQVSVLITQPLQTAMRGLGTVLWTSTAAQASAEHTAVVVFDKPRTANGREQAFFKPTPDSLPQLAGWLRARGVRHLLVVMPHTQASLPEALRHGLANLDEHAVAMLDFEHLVFMRTAQAPEASRHPHPAQRLANWMLSQLHWMVPQRQRAVRAQHVAAFAAQLAARLPASPPGTRVVPPEVVWESAQARRVGDMGGVCERWLSGQPLPETRPDPLTPPSRI